MLMKTIRIIYHAIELHNQLERHFQWRDHEEVWGQMPPAFAKMVLGIS